jgi:hypothetical protein
MKKPINMKMDVEIVRKCKIIARENKKTFTQLVTDVLFEYIKEYDKEDKNGI